MGSKVKIRRVSTEAATTSETDRLSELYSLHATSAVRLAYLLTGDLPLSEDLVQEAFVKLAGRLRHIRDAGAFDAYLRTTVLNLARMHFRRRAVERRYLRKEIGVARDEVPEHDLSERDALRKMLFRLPDRQRTAIVLRYYVDLPERDISELMRCRPGTVRSLLSRGLSALRAEIGG